MRATRAWVEALRGNGEAAGELLDSSAPRFALLANNFMGGFGLVGAGEATLILQRSDLVEPLREVLRPWADRMLGHPWAPSLAAADVLSRLDAMQGDHESAAVHRDQALDLYRRLGCEVLRDRLEAQHASAS